jgi:hypothetical protein
MKKQVGVLQIVATIVVILSGAMAFYANYLTVQELTKRNQ